MARMLGHEIAGIRDLAITDAIPLRRDPDEA